MATIKDVSKLAGVSVATVSRVLNQNGYVHEDTEKKVLNAIKELNYAPNLVARSMTKKTSKTIALIVPDITNPFFNELAKAVENVTYVYGYTTILCNSDDSPDKEKHYVDVLRQKYIDGFILASNTLSATEVEDLTVPVVTLDRIISDDVPSVTADNRVGARKAVQFLLDQGCRKIAHIRGPEHFTIPDERCQGYLDMVQQLDWFEPGLIVNGLFKMDKAAEEAYQLMESYPDLDGIFAGNDIMAIGALRAAQMYNLTVPGGLEIIGYDGIPISVMVYPELTTIAQPIYDMGLTAARILIKLIESKPLESLHHVFPVYLLERGTTSKSES